MVCDRNRRPHVCKQICSENRQTFSNVFFVVVCLLFLNTGGRRPRSELLRRLQTTAVPSPQSTRLAQLVINRSCSVCFYFYDGRSARLLGPNTATAAAGRRLGVCRLRRGVLAQAQPPLSGPAGSVLSWDQTHGSRWNFTPAVKYWIPDVCVLACLVKQSGAA